MGLTTPDPNSPRAKKNLKKLEAPVETVGPMDVDLKTLKEPPKPQGAVARGREAEGQLDMPSLIQMSWLPYRAWDPGMLLRAKQDADSGILERGADLCESMLADTVVAGSLQLRINGLAGLPLRFIGSNDATLEAISADFFALESSGAAQQRRLWGLLYNVVPIFTRELVELDGRVVPIIEPWSPRWLRWRWELGGVAWFIATSQGEIRLSDYPGRWSLYCPLGFAGGRPWVNGLWYSLATWWLGKSYAMADLFAFSQSHATPKWFLTQMDGTISPGTDKDAQKRSAIRFLARLPERSGMYVPFGYEVKQEETSSYAWQAIKEVIDQADKAMKTDILGSDAGTTANANYASSYSADGVRWDLMISDADAESAYFHDGPLALWHALNFRGTKQLESAFTFSGVRRVLEMERNRAGVWTLEQSRPRRVNRLLGEDGSYRRQQFLQFADSRIRSGDDVPWPVRDATPPEDLVQIADSQGKAATALATLTTAAAADPGVAEALALMDVPRFLGRYFPMKGQDESGIQLEDGSRTHFPKRGDDRAVSLSTSEYETFEPAYVADLLASWPEIWELTETQGDRAYHILEPVVERGGVPDTDDETAAIRQRETWASSHYGNNRLAGVIALMKWFVVGRIGASKMKDIVDERKDLVRARRRQLALEQRGPQLLLESPKNIRQHLHDGLALVDETVDLMASQNPVTMGDVTGQVLRVLSNAKDFPDARKRLLEAFPTLDRDPLQNMLTGGMMLLQAAGRYTVKQETE